MKPPAQDYLGTHISIAGGVELAPRRARMLGCSAMQIFTKSNRSWKDRPLTEDRAEAFRATMRGSRIDAAFAHSTYLINPGTTDAAIAGKSLDALVDELTRCEMLGLPGLVLHPGAHGGRGERRGIATIAKNLKSALRRTRGFRAAIYLENVAGQGTAVGRTFEELGELRERVGDAERIAFCFDTCHALAAGHDIRTPEGYAEVMDSWHRLIGLDAIRAFHLNDSKRPLASRRDRHEHIGRGEVGLAAFHSLLNDARFAGIPKVLETPKREDAHEDIANLRVLRRLIGAKTLPKRRPSWRIPETMDAEFAQRLRRGE